MQNDAISTQGMPRKEWLDYRNKLGLGGSDAASVFEDLNPYMSPFTLWGLKTGLYTPEDVDTDSKFSGRYMEEHIANLWQYWETDFATCRKNYEEGKIVRQCEPWFEMIPHPDPKYSFMYANVDRRIPDRGDGRGFGILECKNMRSGSLNRWKTGLPPNYFIQVQHYMAVTGAKWAEIAIWVDGYRLEVFCIDRNDSLIEKLMDAELNFWERVLKTREAIEKGESYEQFEPAPDGSKGYTIFLKDKFQTTNGEELQGSWKDYERCVKRKELKESIAAMQAQIKKIDNTLKRHMGENAFMRFENKGYISWNTNRSGKRTFNVRLK